MPPSSEQVAEGFSKLVISSIYCVDLADVLRLFAIFHYYCAGKLSLTMSELVSLARGVVRHINQAEPLFLGYILFIRTFPTVRCQ